MKRILITGQGGAIGSALARHLSAMPQDYGVERLSLRTEDWRAASFSGIDAVVHAAGMAHVRATRQNTGDFLAVNRDLAVQAARKAKAEGVRQFILLSSLAVYGVEQGVIAPDRPPAPKGPYGESKWAAEQDIAPLADDAFAVCILRAPMVVGAGCRGRYAQLAALAGALPVFPETGNARSVVHIDTLCAFIRRCIDETSGGVYIPQEPAPVSTAALAQAAAREQGKTLRLSPALGAAVTALCPFVPPLRRAFSSLAVEEKDMADGRG